MMMMMTAYRAWIYPCCNSMLIALGRPQSSSWLFLSLMVRAGYICVAIIHQTDMDHRISIMCTDVNACDCTQQCTNTERESALKADSGKKIPLLNQGIEPVSTAWRSDALTNWATSHPHVWFQALLTVGMFALRIAHPRLSVPHFVSLWGVETLNADDKYVRLVCFLLHASINRFTALTSRSKKASIYDLREATASRQQVH